MKNLKWHHYVILAVVVLAFFFFIYYKPKSNETKYLKSERINVEEDVRKSQAKKRQVDKIEEELNAMNKTLEELEAIIPQKKEIGIILKKIQQLALNSQLNITRFAPQGQISHEFYSEWPIIIEFTGSYHNLRAFFERLSNFSRIFTIENFSIQSLPKQSDSTTISASCTAKTYIFHEDAAAKMEAKKPQRKKA